MSANLQLRAEIIRRYGGQIYLAHQFGIHEARLSRICRGHVKPLKAEREALERALGKARVRRLLRQ